MLLTRKKLEKMEAKQLAPYAVKSAESKGREYEESPDPHRLAFQLDRDRIIHSKAFRRLKAKTQVFVAHYGDHYRTRLTHTLEVAQIARGVARTLGLNEDLTEAVALAHDLGHTPFGHAGEKALNECLQPFALRFEHNAQSQRIVEKLEQVYPDFPGLNLSYEVRMGLIKHRTPWDKPVEQEPTYPCLEAQVVNLADEIAYLNHDLDDGLSARILEWEKVVKLPLFAKAMEAAEKKYDSLKNDSRPVQSGSDQTVVTPRDVLFRGAPQGDMKWRPRVISQLINLMILDLYATSEKLIRENGIESLENVYQSKKQLIDFSLGIKKEIQEINQFLLKNLYFHPRVYKKSQSGQKIIRDLWAKYEAAPDSLPVSKRSLIEAGEPKEVVIKDYIAGMTDEFAEKQWVSL